VLVPCDAEEAEALLWRLLASLATGLGAGEQITARLAPVITEGRAFARLACTLPTDLAREDDLFAATVRPASSAINVGLFGVGFALRLARAEARVAGGALLREGDTLVLCLPLLNASTEISSQAVGSAAGSAS
jgi:hypothetical protein